MKLFFFSLSFSIIQFIMCHVMPISFIFSIWWKCLGLTRMDKNYLYYTIKWKRNSFSKSYKHDVKFSQYLNHPESMQISQSILRINRMKSPKTKMMIEEVTGFCYYRSFCHSNCERKDFILLHKLPLKDNKKTINNS